MPDSNPTSPRILVFPGRCPEGNLLFTAICVDGCAIGRGENLEQAVIQAKSNFAFGVASAKKVGVKFVGVYSPELEILYNEKVSEREANCYELVCS